MGKQYVRVTASGAITIPAYLRRQYSIQTGDVYHLEAGEGELFLVRESKKCLYCGADESNVKLISVLGKPMCVDCMGELAQEIKEKKPKKRRRSSNVKLVQAQ